MKPVDFTIYWEETPVVQVCYDENNKPQFTVLNPSHLPVLLFGMNGNSIIAVKDDGCGFGDVDPKLLFDRFYRTDASRTRGTGGTGLGLAIVKSIAEAHDGTVEAVNLPEGGACFMIVIPSIPADISVKKPHGKTKGM